VEVLRPHKPAPLGRRVLAAIIDAAVVLCSWYTCIEVWGHPSSGASGKVIQGAPAFLIMAVTAAYWIVPEWLFGATFGKWMCDIKVVSIGGRACSLSQAIKRNVLRIVDGFGLYLVGFLAAKFNPNRQRLGDQWARTIVVEVPEEPNPSTHEPSR